MRLVYITTILYLLIAPSILAQPKEGINWLSFEALDSALTAEPKMVLIDFYATWCTYCRKMDKRVFTNPEVITFLNQNYYAVKMDAETKDTILFDGIIFTNQKAVTDGKGIHQIPTLLAQRQGKFTAPTLVILNQDFKVQKRYFEYMDSQKLLKALKMILP